jgi:hypothetical protein
MVPSSSAEIRHKTIEPDKLIMGDAETGSAARGNVDAGIA